MTSITILYLGEAGAHTTSEHRAEALRRLGFNVIHVDVYRALRGLGAKLSGAFHFRSGYRFVQGRIEKLIRHNLAKITYASLIWVDSGELLGASCIEGVKQQGIKAALFNHDDATGTRDGRRFDSLKQALPLYDVSVAVRQESAEEYRKLGAKNVLLHWRTYDEVAHKPFDNVDEIPQTYRSDIAFIGTWIAGENRDAFLLRLIQHNLPISIWGARWEKSPLWEQLKPYWRGPGLGGRDYVAAMQGAKLCLGLLSKQNRDRHTTRSMEIPYAGGLLCAERTDDHLRLYEENVEAVFWVDADECAAKCKWLLQEPIARESIRLAGMRRVRQNKVGNEDLCRRVLESIGMALPPAAPPSES